MNWANLKEMKCPKTGSNVFEDTGMGYRWPESDFFISYEKFQKIISNTYNLVGGKKYNPDLVDRSGWS